MARPTKPITLTPGQGTLIQTLFSCREITHSLAQRVRMVLKISEGHTNKSASKELGVSEETVGTWRKRRVESSADLDKLEQKPKQLREKIINVLADKPGSGCPDTFTPEQVCLILAVACEKPPEAISHWSRNDLVHEVTRRGIVEKISPGSIGRFLEQGDLKPHRSKYWLNHEVEDEADFRKEVREICKIYHQAQELHEKGIHVISVDEKTGVQALERTYPTRSMEPGKPEAQEFEYTRHGTQALIANFEVATGKVICPSAGDTQTEVDYVAHIRTMVETDPEGEWIFIQDQLNTHKSEGLVNLVAELCDLNDDLGEKGKTLILKDMKTRAEFLSDKKHRIRFIYTPKHCSWLNQVEIWFGILTRRLLKRGDFLSTTDLKRKMLAFIELFNKTMAKPFRWTYIGKPLMV
jgi:transposase